VSTKTPRSLGVVSHGESHEPDRPPVSGEPSRLIAAIHRELCERVATGQQPHDANSRPAYGVWDCERMARAIEAEARATPPSLDVLTRHDWRLVLWENHGHEALYGDDGQLQCPQYPPADFLRDTPDQLIAHISFDKTFGESRPASDSEEPRHYENDNCGNPDHDARLEAWYRRAEAMLDSGQEPPA
jgi:hypothetical protein